jgi:spermidine synthase
MTMKKSDSAPRAENNRMAPLVLTCFFLSGMTALIYEIIWMRMISRVVGGAPFAVSTILVIYMGGLGLGSYLASRRADRMEELRLVRTYGILELAIGIYALFVPILLLFLKPLYALLYNAFFEHTLIYNLFIFGGALLMLALPTICMGATLPLLCRFYVSRLSHVGTHAGRLYGLNTIGAATGALICGFWLIAALGVWGTLLAAVAVNCLIGIVCLRIAAQPPGAVRQRTAASDARREPAAGADPEDNATAGAALIIFMVSGFCAMAYEVLWTKLLGLLVGPTTYSFTIVLVTFIVGLALGNMVFGRLADRSRNAMGLLLASQIAAALLALLISQLFGSSQLFFAKLIYTFRDHFALFSLVKALVLFALMILPTFFLGATFPLVARIYTRSVDEVGRRIGAAYAFNTIGAVLGSFCAGFVLIPLVGKENGLRLVIGLQIATSVLVALVLMARRRTPLVRWAAPVAAMVAGAVLLSQYPSWNRLLLSMGKYHRFDEIMIVDEMIQSTGWVKSLTEGPRILTASERGELVFYGDGIGGFTTVLKYPGPFGEAEFSMANSGKMDASSRGDMKTQTLLAHFPMLFAKNPHRVMVLGLASGVTAGEVLHYPIERVDVVDINEQVFEAARFFTAWNNDVLSHPKARAIVQDGLAHLSLTRTRYDVIISEPSNPWMAGMASLFTRNFFESARNRLTDDGIYVQWFHCYQMDWDTFALIGRTFAEVFPRSILVSCEPGGLSKDFLFVGFKNPSAPDWDAARANIRYAQASKNIVLDNPELLYRLFVSENLNLLFGPGPLNTEDRPRLEYAAPKLMHRDQLEQQVLLQQLASRARLGPETRQAVQNIRQSVDAQIDFAAFALSVHSPFANMVDMGRAGAIQKERYAQLLEKYCSHNPMDLSLAKVDTLVERLRDVQIDALLDKISMAAPNAAMHIYLAEAYFDKGDSEKAIAHYREAVRLEPDNAAAHNDLGYLLFDKGDYSEAIRHYQEALRVRPHLIRALGNIGYAYLKVDRPDDALIHFQKALRVHPDLDEAHYNIGAIYYRKEQPQAAVPHIREALRLNPNRVDALDTLSWILATTGAAELKDPRTAIDLARKACALTDESDPRTLSTLAVAYAAAGRVEDARQATEKALASAPEGERQEIMEAIEKRSRRF